jgi:hypothetical protein
MGTGVVGWRAVSSLEDQAAQRAQRATDVAAYTDKLRGIVAAYCQSLGKYDRETLLANMSQALITTGNTEPDLANMLVIAIDLLARR